MKKRADYVVDFRGAIKSLTLLKLTHVFRGMKNDEVVKIMGVDPDTRSDLFKVLPATAYALVSEEDREGDVCNIHLKKSSSEPRTKSLGKGVAHARRGNQTERK